MKTQTEVEIHLNSIEPLENLHLEPDGYLLKFFLGCSEVHSKTIKINNSLTLLQGQKLKTNNILGDQLEIWLCNTENKIIVLIYSK